MDKVTVHSVLRSAPSYDAAWVTSEWVEGDFQLFNRLGPEPAAKSLRFLRNFSELMTAIINFNPHNYSARWTLFSCLKIEETEAQSNYVTWSRFRYRSKLKWERGNNRVGIWTKGHCLLNTLFTMLDYFLYEYLCNIFSYSLYIKKKKIIDLAIRPLVAWFFNPFVKGESEGLWKNQKVFYLFITET